MIRSLHLLYGLVAYAVFLLVFLYLVGFVGDFSGLSRTVDAPAAAVPVGAALAIDGALTCCSASSTA